MADQQEIVIVDDKGHEHVFPSGFDPKKAAGIVKAQTNRPPLSPVSLSDMMHPSSVPINEAGEKLGPDGKPLHGFNRVVEGMANPSPEQRLGMDVMQLMPGLAEAAPNAPAKIIGAARTATPAVRTGMRFLGRNLSDIDITKPAKPIGRVLEWAGKERPATPIPNPNDVPLYKQMEQVPTRVSGPIPPGASGRTGMSPNPGFAPYSTPEQMTPQQVVGSIRPNPASYLSPEVYEGMETRATQMGDQLNKEAQAAGYGRARSSIQSPHDVDESQQTYIRNILNNERRIAGEPPLEGGESTVIPRFSPPTGPKPTQGAIRIQQKPAIQVPEDLQVSSPSVPPSAGLAQPKSMLERMNLPKTRSSAGPSAVDPRMSPMDQMQYAEYMRSHPQASPEEVVNAILQGRTERGPMHARGELQQPPVRGPITDMQVVE